MKKKQFKKETQQKPEHKKGILSDKPGKNLNYFSLLGISIIVFLGIIIYSNTFKCSFHFDDGSSIVDNTVIRNLSDIQGLWNYGGGRFVGYLTLAVNYHFGQLNVWGYHLVNIMIHLITSCIVYWLTILLFATPYFKGKEIAKHKKILALFVGLLFVSHPLATQSVTYIIQRLSSLAAMFYLLSISLYVKGRLLDKKSSWKYFLLVGAIISAILALFTKQNAYTLPFAIIGIELFFIQKGKIKFSFKDYRTILILLVTICFSVFVFLKFSFSVLKPIPPSEYNHFTITPYNYLFTEFSVILKYLQLILLPISQNLDYDYRVSFSFFELRTIISFIVIVLMIVFAIIIFKKNRLISFGILWFFLTLAVESSIIPIDDFIYEHRTYLPSFGIFLLVVFGIYKIFWKRNRYVAISVFGLMILANSFLAYNRNVVWENDLTLWGDAAQKSPKKARPFLNLGLAYSELKEKEKSIEAYGVAIQNDPKYQKSYYNRGTALVKMEQYEKAISDFTEAIKIKNNYTEAFYNRAFAYNAIDQSEKAVLDYTKTIELDNNFKNAIAYYFRGNVQCKLNNWNKAIDDYTVFLQINPNDADGNYMRGRAYLIIKEYNKSIEDNSKTIEIDPKYKNAYYNRGVSYKNSGNFEKAVKDFSKVIELDPNNKDAYTNRDIALKSLSGNKRK